MLFTTWLLLIITERIFILNGYFSNGFVMNFSKEDVQDKYLMDFSNERVFNYENELNDEMRHVSPTSW